MRHSPIGLSRCDACRLLCGDAQGAIGSWVQVLACVPAFGLEAVLVAAELVLESGPISLEHVRNVLSRLTEPSPAPRLATTLAVQEEPRADAGRYDRWQTLEVGDE